LEVTKSSGQKCVTEISLEWASAGQNKHSKSNFGPAWPTVFNKILGPCKTNENFKQHKSL